MVNMLKIKNVVKSNDMMQVNNIATITNSNTGTYVKMGVTTHNQDNSEVSMLNYQKDTKCQKDSIYNPMLYSATDETLVKSTFQTIGNEPLFGHCITTQDIMDIYAHGCIQGFYEEYCKLHTDKENLILAKVLSILGIEVYKDVVCFGGIYKGRYMVSNIGNVKRLYKTKQAKILKPYANPNGYLNIHLCYKGQRKLVGVHRLVGMTFYNEEPTEKVASCHANTVKTDNRLFNLKLATYSENMNNPLTQKKYRNTIDNRTTSTTASTLE